MTPPPASSAACRAPGGLTLAVLLAACAGGTPPPRSAANPAPPPPPAAIAPRLALPGGPHAVEVHMAPGLEGVIGATAAQLIAAFGPARLDVQEGDAHKLQFTGTACVLDVFLYPGTAAADEPRATYVDARRSEDGKDLDRATCVAALRRPE